MKNKLNILLSVLLLVLAVVAVVLLVFHDKKQASGTEVVYEITGVNVDNNHAVVTVKSGVVSGDGVDPFRYVRLLDQFNLPNYPLNGFAKPSLDRGDILEISFIFFYPRTSECTLEILDSSGRATEIPVVLPELVVKEQKGIFAN